MGSSLQTRDRTSELEAENARLKAELEASRLEVAEVRAAYTTHLTTTQFVLDFLPSMVGYWDKTLHNQFCNAAYGVWFDLDPAKVPGMHIRDVIGEERYRLNLPYMEEALRGHYQQFERMIPSPDGKIIRHSLAEYIPFIENGEVQGFFVQVTDISPIKAAEKALQEAKEVAETANAAKSRFLAIMSHELRTPLNGILGMAQLLQQPGVDETERCSYARTIYASGNTLLTLLNDILDLSKIEAGKLEIEQLPFTPKELLQEVNVLFNDLARKKNIQLITRWPLEAERVYMGDPNRLRQMLTNLVSNALKFSEGGEVVVEAKLLELTSDAPLLELAVSDTGIGIPQEKLPLLFMPFTQADASITRQFGGTGLGLSIVKGLVQLMGGTVAAESTLGKGSRFWLRIPVRHSSAPAT